MNKEDLSMIQKIEKTEEEIKKIQKGIKIKNYEQKILIFINKSQKQLNKWLREHLKLEKEIDKLHKTQTQIIMDNCFPIEESSTK